MGNPNPNMSGLKSFKKGQCGNPKGRPKLPDLRQVMAEILGQEKDGVTALKAIVAKLKQLAAQGNIKAAEILLARGYGLPKQPIDVTTGGEKIQIPIVIDWTEDSKKNRADTEAERGS